MRATGVQTGNSMPHRTDFECACRRCVLARFVGWYEDLQWDRAAKEWEQENL